jgi:hypothetical protein
MAESARRSVATPYDRDLAAWSEEQARMLRAHSAAHLDWVPLAEEIEGLGSSGRNEIRDSLAILLLHFLKWEFQPDARTNSWAASLLEQRQRISEVIDESPSLRGFPAQVVEKEYRVARLKASGETGLPIERFPASNPYAISDILDEAFLPGRRDA